MYNLLNSQPCILLVIRKYHLFYLYFFNYRQFEKYEKHNQVLKQIYLYYKVCY